MNAEPLEVEAGWSFWTGRIASGEKLIGDVAYHSEHDGQGWPAVTDLNEAKANLRLCVSAPELLEALEDLLAVIPKQTDDCDWWQDDLTHAVAASRAAIAKAVSNV